MTSGTRTIGPSPTGAGVANSFGFYKSWSGGNGRYEVVAGHKRSKWNNYTATIVTRYVGKLNVQGRVKNSPTDPTWSNFNQGFGFTSMGSWPQLGDFSASEDLILQQRLLERVKGHSFNLAVFSAEQRKSTDLVLGTLGTFGRAFRSLKRGDFATAARTLGVSSRGGSSLTSRDVAGRWLELQYGWKPLVNDCYEAFEAYHKLAAPPRVTTVRASISKNRTVTVSGGSAGSFYKTTGRLTRRRVIRYEMSESLSAARQLGLTNPLSVAWELLPYSFVLDWFVPIGTYLDNFAQIPKLKGRFMTSNSYVGDQVKVSAKDPTSVGYNNPIVEYSSITEVVYKESRVTREVSSTLTPPGPSFNLNGLEKGTRVWNALALARNAFKL